MKREGFEIHADDRGEDDEAGKQGKDQPVRDRHRDDVGSGAEGDAEREEAEQEILNHRGRRGLERKPASFLSAQD
jgi:hypothetical protein